MKKSFLLLLILLFCGVVSQRVNGQTAIPNITAVTQDFDGMAATTTLPSNWRMQQSATPTWAGGTTTLGFQASSGAPTGGGTYNWGSSVAERAAGVMTSGGYASPNSLMAFFQNTNANAITSLTISYDLERYRRNTANASVQFFYSTNGTTWTPATAGDVAAGSIPTGTNLYGYPQASVAVAAFTISSLAVPNNGSIYLRWNLNTTGSNSQGISVDNVSVTAAFCTTPTAAITIAETSGTANDGTICNGNAVSLTATGGGTYLWSTTETTAAINPSNTATATYTVTVTNAGCSSTASSTITVNSTPIIGDDLGDTACSGSSSAVDLYSNQTGTTVTWTAVLTSGSATGFSDSATPIAVNDINTPSGTNDIDQLLTNTGTGNAIVTYTITPTANGCAGAPYDVAITIFPALDIAFAPICNGSTYDLGFTISGGSPAYYATFATAGTLGVSSITGIPVATTTVSLDIEDDEFCTYTESYTFTQPTLSLAASCGGGAGTGILTPTFTAGAGGTPSYNPATLTSLADGTYTVTVTESPSGCQATASATVSCGGAPIAVGSADGTDPCYCISSPTLDGNNVVLTNGTFGDVMTITTTPPNTSLTWQVSTVTATSPTVLANFTHIGGGVYEIAVIYPAGAGGSAGTWSITATETSGSGLPNITVSGGSLCAYTIGTLADVTATVCSNTPITLTATPIGGTYGGAGAGGTYTPTPTGTAQGPFAYSYTYDAHPAVGSNAACPLTLTADISVPACIAACSAAAAAPTGTITPTSFCVTGGLLTGSTAADPTVLNFFDNDRYYLLVDDATGIVVSNATTIANLAAPSNAGITPKVYKVYSLAFDVVQGVNIIDGTSTITAGANIIKDLNGDALLPSPTATSCMALSAAAATAVTVYPALLIGDDLDDTACNGTSSAIDLYSNQTGTTVTWTAVLTSGSATGFSDSATPIAVNDINTPSGTNDIDQLLTNTGTGNAIVTYTITPTANGCAGAPYDVAITIFPALDIAFAPTCNGSTYDLGFTISGGSPAYYATFATAGTLGVSSITGIPIATTTVSLEIIDDESCTYTESYTFTQPTLSLAASCGGGAGTGILTPTFTAGAGGTPSYNPATLTGLADGTYTVTVTENPSGCQATASATVSCSGALIAVGSADVADPCYCVTPPTLDGNNVVLTNGTFGDVMTITTSPVNTNLVWEVSATNATTPIVGTNFTNNNDGTYTLNITYPAGVGGAAGSWSITAIEKTGSGLAPITVSGGSLCAYNIGTLADVLTTACSGTTINLIATPAGGTYGGAATGAGTYTPTPNITTQGPFPYNYTYDAHPAVGIHPACPITLRADITVPACPNSCTPAVGTW